MFDQYTERARRVIFFARYEASQLGGTTIEPHHLLLGLIREAKELTERFIRGLSSIEGIRKEIEERTEIRERVPTSIDLPLSNECKRILAYAHEEAHRLADRHIGTEHLLLGILREETCLAAEILISRGLRLEAIRDELARSGPGPDRQTGFPEAAALGSGLTPDIGGLIRALETHGLTTARQHLSNAVQASSRQDWETAQEELQLFLEALVDGIRKSPNGGDVVFPIFDGFDWNSSLRSLQSGLSPDEDWRFRLRLTSMLAEVLLKRFHQRLNS